MKHVTIGTAGHTGHGTTSLIRSLNGIKAGAAAVDEASRTVEYSALKLPDGTTTTVVDARGDDGSVGSFIAGAAGMDVFLLVVAAYEGITARTREHLGILSLLGIENGVIAITKIDLVTREQSDTLSSDIRILIKGTPLESTPIFRVSAATRQGVNALRRALQSTVSRVPARNASLPVRLLVDDVVFAGRDATLSGTLTAGTLKVGDPVEIVPGNFPIRVRGLEVLGARVKAAEAGMRVSVRLEDAGMESVEAGAQLVAPGSISATKTFDASLRLLPCAGLAEGRTPVRIYVGAAEVSGTVALLGKDSGEAGIGDGVYARIAANAEFAAARGDRFVVVDSQDEVTLGGGIILDTAASGACSPASNVVESLAARQRGTPEDLLETLLQAEPLGISRRQLYDNSGLRVSDAEAGLRILLARGNTVVLPGERLFARSSLVAITERARTILETYHTQFPTRAGMPRPEFRAALEPNREQNGLRSNVFSALLSHWKRQDVVVTEGLTIRLATFQPRLNERQESLLQRIESIYREYGIAFPPIDEVSRQVNAPPDAVNALLKSGVETGRFIKIEEGVFYHRDTLQELRRLVEDTIAESGSFTVGAFRDLTESNRRFAMLILEYFDEIRFTRRFGAGRILYGSEPAPDS